MIRKKDEGVSPVIAVILIVALTVILLGMAAAMFMGITSNAVGNMNTSFLQPTIKVVYNGNENTGGVVPVDSLAHYQGEIITVADASDITRSGYYFDSWNTNAYGTGTKYNVGEEITLYTDIYLYAVWIYITDFHVHYERGNNPDASFEYFKSGVRDPGDETKSTKVKIGKPSSEVNMRFVSWNTKPDGTGKEYKEDDEYDGSDGDITLYAQWEDASSE